MEAAANKPDPNGTRILCSATAKQKMGALPVASNTPSTLPGQGSLNRSATGSPAKKKSKQNNGGSSIPPVTLTLSTPPKSPGRSSKGRRASQRKSSKAKGSPSQRKPGKTVQSGKTDHKFSVAYVHKCAPDNPGVVYSYHDHSAGRVSRLPGCLMSARLTVSQLKEFKSVFADPSVVAVDAKAADEAIVSKQIFMKLWPFWQTVFDHLPGTDKSFYKYRNTSSDGFLQCV